MGYMHPILAMGDIATPVLLVSLLMIDGILLIAVGLFAFSLWKRSLAALVIASIFVLIDGYLVVTTMPWARDAFLGPLTEDNFKNPALIFWCRVAAVIWILAFMAAVVYFVRAIKKRKEARMPPDQSPEPIAVGAVRSAVAVLHHKSYERHIPSK
jgi:hypothetical protein